MKKFKKFLIKRAKRSWIIVIGIIIALVVGGVYIAPDLIRKVQETLASSSAVEHNNWSGGGGQLNTTNAYTTEYDASYNIDVKGGEEGIKLKTLDQKEIAEPQNPGGALPESK